MMVQSNIESRTTPQTHGQTRTQSVKLQTPGQSMSAIADVERASRGPSCGKSWSDNENHVSPAQGQPKDDRACTLMMGRK